MLAELGQLAGAHSFIAALSFNFGVVLAELVGAALAFALMRLLFARVLGLPLGVVVVSAVLGHQAWHWMLDRAHGLEHELEHAGHAGLRYALTIALLCLLPALVFGSWAWRGLRRYDGAPLPSLLAKSHDGKTARDS